MPAARVCFALVLACSLIPHFGCRPKDETSPAARDEGRRPKVAPPLTAEVARNALVAAIRKKSSLEHLKPLAASLEKVDAGMIENHYSGPFQLEYDPRSRTFEIDYN